MPIETASDIREGIEALELASGERLETLEFVRATLGASLDSLVENGARNNANLRRTVKELVTHAISALEELEEIPPGLEVIAVITTGELRDIVGVEFGIRKGTPTRDVERLLPYLGGCSRCLV